MLYLWLRSRDTDNAESIYSTAFHAHFYHNTCPFDNSFGENTAVQALFLALSFALSMLISSGLRAIGRRGEWSLFRITACLVNSRFRINISSNALVVAPNGKAKKA